MFAKFGLFMVVREEAAYAAAQRRAAQRVRRKSAGRSWCSATMQRLWEREGAVGGRAVVSWAGVALARQARMARLGKRLAGKCGEEGELRQAARHNGYWAGGMGVEGGG